MPTTHPTFAHQWFEEVWNQGNLSAIDRLAHPEAKAYGFPNPESVSGRDGFKEAASQFRSAFSEIHVRVDDVISEGDKMAVRWTARIKHTGNGLGIAPTGESATLQGMSFLEMRDGLLYRGWNAFDLATTISRLGAIAASQQGVTTSATAG